ncbi:MAG: UDP-glucose/GDP-mannose dehydrogenase family protein [Pseudomonadota bacterium]
MKVTIFGTGYVGLVTGACLAETGNDVVCLDINEAVIEKLNNGEIPFHEPGLGEIVKRNVEGGRLVFTTDVKQGVDHGLFQFIAVGTPPDEDGSADLQYVLAVAESIGRNMDEYRIIVDKSTVPVGTADKVKATVDAALAERDTQVEFDVVSNPEFLKEGAAVGDFMKPDRIIIGTDNPRVTELMRLLYDPYTRRRDRLIDMSVRSAELAKYAANAMLATKISFMNELANIAGRFGADIEDVRLGIGADPRIGYHFIYPGCGYGGSCFPKDVQALARSAREVSYEPTLLDAVESVNQRQRSLLFQMMQRYWGDRLDGLTVALWGLAFKPNTDDMRSAPSRNLMEALWDAGATVRAYDPVASAEARRLYPDTEKLTLASGPEDALRGADCLAIVTEWSVFRSPHFERIRDELTSPVIFDGRNLYDPDYMRRQGFEYFAIGRGASLHPVDGGAVDAT